MSGYFSASAAPTYNGYQPFGSYGQAAPVAQGGDTLISNKNHNLYLSGGY